MKSEVILTSGSTALCHQMLVRTVKRERDDQHIGKCFQVLIFFRYWLTESDNVLVTPLNRFSAIYFCFAREHELNGHHLSESSGWFPPTRKLRTLVLPRLFLLLWPPREGLQQQHWETSRKQRQEELQETRDNIRRHTSIKTSLCFWWHLHRTRHPKGLHNTLLK